MKINFIGGTKTLTGSCYLLDIAGNKVLLDCGQFQGGKNTDALNYEGFPFNPSEIDTLILSHAHIDHSGRIPLLVKEGFKGDIYCTDATGDLAGILLRDSGYIHEKDAEFINKKNKRAGKPMIEPLYTYEDAEKAMPYFKTVLYDQTIDINPAIKLRFRDAGHILGSAIVELWLKEDGKTTKLVFSGDLGYKHRPILKDPVMIEETDYLMMETTYGNRFHSDMSKSFDHFIDIIVKTFKRGGTSIIPAFAVGRTQELIYEMAKYSAVCTGEVKDVLDKLQVYVDSPLATSATEIFKRNAQVFDEETREIILKGKNPLDFKNLKFTKSTEESRLLNEDRSPKVIISASGMCDAGRIKHHLKHNAWDSRNSIIFVGYQAKGSLGDRIKSGEKDVVIHGEPVHINAQIHALDGFSGHADQGDLLEWLGGFKKEPKKIFFVHGEEEAKEAFVKVVKAKFGYESIAINNPCEYELINSTTVIKSDSDESSIGLDEANKVREKLYRLHHDMDRILYHANLAVGNELDVEKYEEINNQLLEIEKNVINIGSTLSDQSKIGLDVKE